MTETPSYARADLLEGGTVLRLTLDRPKGNVLSRAMMSELTAALEAHRDDLHLRLVILRGAHGDFSYGAAVAEHVPELAPSLLGEFHAFVRKVATFPVPIAALIEGRCLGGALELALVCHFVFAAAGARLGCPEIRLGVYPPVLAAAGALRLGGAFAERLMLAGEDLDVEAFARAGLVSDVFPAGTDPEQALLAWYRRQLAPLSAYSLRVATRVSRESSGLIESLGDPLAAAERAYLERLLPSHDGNEGIAAFLARRTPAWRDE
jgi:cyclohexa-1,5-dienecarbonyl-CoA hydratase